MPENLKHTYDYEIDLNSDVAPARVLGFVQPGSRVLEIGAGPGSITRHLVNTLDCDVVALEIDESALIKLRQVVNRIYTYDLNDPSWSEKISLLEGRFDYVIAADVLEHVYDPWSVLAQMKALLNETGSIILSLPHVGHAAIGACLLDEDFEYRPWGLLDRTHIRFFGIKNIQHLFNSQGLAIEESHFVVRTPLMTEFALRWKRLPRKIRSVLTRNRFAFVYQVVSRAVPTERASRDIDLLGCAVKRPSVNVETYWNKAMEAYKPLFESDERSTITGAKQLLYDKVSIFGKWRRR